MKKKLPLGISTFSKLIEEKYLYVDKTQHIYNLITEGTYYFLSRPRRFGKSLLISTLKEIFSGNRKLFKGLWIDSSDYTWPEHPVIHLDFSTIAHSSAQDLNQNLLERFDEIATENKIQLSPTRLLQQKLVHLVKELSTKAKVVVLVDEYDYPLLKHLNDEGTAKEVRNVLSSLYATLKGLDKYIKAGFITGITKFSKTSIFSGMNNLRDITLLSPTADLLGYTKEEIDLYFEQHIQHFSQTTNRSLDEIYDEMEQWYNGYRFSDSSVSVYNPYSVMNYLVDMKLKNYWFETGTPTYLVELMRNQYYLLENISQTPVNESAFSSFDTNNVPLIPIMFQAGYLTIDSYDAATRTYTLRYPNKEVEISFKDYLLSFFLSTSRFINDGKAQAISCN